MNGRIWPSALRPLIALLAAQETSPSVLYGLYDVLYSVGAVFPDMTIGEPGPEALDVRIVAAGAEPFRCIGNVMVEPHASPSTRSSAGDVVIVCDMYTPIHDAAARQVSGARSPGSAGCTPAARWSALSARARSCWPRPGLLDGREAAPHWAYRRSVPAQLSEGEGAEGFRAVSVHEAEGIVTAGAVTAWQDLALHLIARFCGQQQALRTAKVFLLSGHEEGQLPFAAMTRQSMPLTG